MQALIERRPRCSASLWPSFAAAALFADRGTRPASKPVTGLPESALVLGTDTGSVYIAVTAGGIQIKGDVTVDGKLAAGGVEMTTHTHPGDSGGTTGGPQ